MTCIIGLADAGKVYIAGDSAAVADWDMQICKNPKVFVNGEFVFGYTDSFRMGQLLQYSLVPPRRHPDTDVLRYMVTDFIDAVRACFRDAGFAQRDCEVESGGNFLVGYQGRLFEVQRNYQILENVEGVAAIGCGYQVALGALLALRSRYPGERALLALDIVEKCNAGVCGPFHILSI